MSIDLISIIGVNIALVALVSGLNYWLINRVDADVKSLNTRIDGICTRLDGHANRIDQLYRMFVELLREKNNR